MHKLLLFIGLLSVSVSIQAQESVTKDLDSILDLDQAKTYLSTSATKGSKLVSFNEEKHKTALAKKLFASGRATTESDFEITHYKIVETNMLLHYRVSYIFLDGKKLSTSEIHNSQSLIMSKHEKGVPFNKLAQQYSMNSSARYGGDTGWITQGKMNPEFEDMVINSPYSVGDLFTIDITDKQWHYVVLKTYDIKYIKVVKAIKVVEKKG